MTPLSVEIHRIFRYGLVGVATNLFLYVLFLALLHLDLSPMLAAGICYVLGVAMSYVLNRRWTFTSNDGQLQDLTKFLIAYGLGLVSSLLTISCLILWLPPEPAQLLNVLITAIIIYGCLRALHFGSSRAKHADIDR